MADSSPLLEAARALDAPLVRKLLKSGIPATTTGERGDTALHWVANWQTEETTASIAIAKALLDAGGDVNAQNADGITALASSMGGLYGIDNEKQKLIKLLLQRGADPNLANRFGWVALRDTHRIDIANLLRDAGANIDPRDKDGATPLFEHVKSERAEMVAWCLANGADVNAKDKKGLTPLHRAAETENAAIVKSLLAAGAKTEVKNRAGQTPAQLAPNTGKGKAVVKLLQAAPAAKPGKSPAAKPTSSKSKPKR
jgi:ankyrin repeat protein